jgi:alpha-N-arabinofuranosidase
MAIIRIDPDRTLGRVDRRIFGGFVEHLGRCIYGGLYEPGSPLADEHGFRRDVLDALRALRMPVLRWPGGNFVSNYHWTDGIGPVEQRPKRIELAWHDVEPNRFGTDDFLRYCEVLGVEPYICVNMGTGTIDEAAGWLEYCNGTQDTYWANLRRRNGREEPYGVKLWGLGNEMYGPWQVGALDAHDYVKRAREFAKVLRWTDPSITLVGCGETGLTDWDRIVLEGLAEHVDMHSIHIYTGATDYWTSVLMPHQAERALRRMRGLIDHVRYERGIERPITVAYDEWNVWYRETGSPLEERYDPADALAVATFLNVFVRHCDVVEMANLAQMVNVIAPIFTRPDGLYRQTIYHPFRLASEHTLEVALDAFVDVPTHTLDERPESTRWPHRVADLNPFPLLDVAATRDAARGRLTLSVVNRSPDEAVTARIELLGLAPQGAVQLDVLAAEPGAVNSFEAPDAVTPRGETLPAGSDGLVHAFPPASHTMLRATTG